MKVNKPNPELAEQNRLLFENLQRLEQRDDEPGAIRARQAIVEKNIGLVYWYAGRYQWAVDEGRVEMGDLVGAGVIGMYKAIKKFDLSRGFTFSTYARHWIRSHVDEAARGGDVVKMYHKWLPRGAVVSLDAPIGKKDGSAWTRHDIMDSGVDGPEALVANEEEVDVVCQACRLVGDRSGERTAQAMSKRLVEGQTLIRIADGLGVTKQCVNIMEQRFVQNVRRELERTG